MILVDFSRIFSTFSSVRLVDRRPEWGWSSTLISPLLNRANHSKTCVWLSASSLKAFWRISRASVAVFPRRKQNLKQIRCSVLLDIMISREELDNTWENWQHKPIQPSTATSTWLLTREGCNYTHLAGEHSTTIRKSSPKPVWFFLGPPSYTLNRLVQYGIEGKFVSFCCNLYVTLCHVVPCLQLSSAQKLRLFCQRDRTCDRTVFRSYYPSWYSARFTALLPRATAWQHTTWSIMQLILQSEAGPFEVLWNIMKMVQGKFIYSDFCNLVTININFTRHTKNMTVEMTSSLIHMLLQLNWKYSSWNYCALEM